MLSECGTDFLIYSMYRVLHILLSPTMRLIAKTLLFALSMGPISGHWQFLSCNVFFLYSVHILLFVPSDIQQKSWSAHYINILSLQSALASLKLLSSDSSALSSSLSKWNAELAPIFFFQSPITERGGIFKGELFLNYFLHRILTRLLEVSDDPQVIAVAAHDIGEYVRHYPRGKR